MTDPIVSIIVPTYNSAKTLEACLRSITEQAYDNIELIVVDNNSADNTKQVASKYTPHVYNRGPERSAQRNFGVEQATGEYVMIIDSDMELGQNVAAQCVAQFNINPHLMGVTIPEESFGEGFWAQCKRLERSYYVGVSWMEAARCFRRATYQQAGGYDEAMVSGEDWDLSQRIAAMGPLGHIAEFIRHNEGHLKLISTLKKKYYYAQKFSMYTRKTSSKANLSSQTGPFKRYALYFSKPARLLANPLLGIGMLFMKTSEFAVGGVGLLIQKGKPSA